MNEKEWSTESAVIFTIVVSLSSSLAVIAALSIPNGGVFFIIAAICIMIVFGMLLRIEERQHARKRKDANTRYFESLQDGDA